MPKRAVFCAVLAAATAHFCAAAAGAPWKKAEIEYDSCTVPSWSPDGKVLAFAAREGDAVLVWTMDQKGKRLKCFESLRIKPEAGGSKFMPVEIVWVRNPDAPMLILGEMIPGDQRTGGDRCALLRFFVLEAGKPDKANQVAATSPMGPGPAFGPGHFAALPAGKGAAVCFTGWPFNLTADEVHCGTFISVMREGGLNLTGKKFRWIENAPDGRLIGVRHDVIAVVDASGNAIEELARLDKVPAAGFLKVLRVSRDCSKMAWGLWVNPGPPTLPHMSWFWKEKGKDQVPLAIKAFDGAVITDVSFLSDGQVVVAVEGQGKAMTQRILNPAEGGGADWPVPGLPAGGAYMFRLSPWGTAGVAACSGPGVRIGKGEVACRDSAGFAFALAGAKPEKASAIGFLCSQPMHILGGQPGKAEADLRFVCFPVSWAPERAAFAALCQKLVNTGDFIDQGREEDPRRNEGKLVIWSADK